MAVSADISRHLYQRALLGLVTVFFCLLPLRTLCQTTAPTPSASIPAVDLTVSPEEEIKILDAIDGQSNTPEAQQTPSAAVSDVGQAATGTAAPASYTPPPAPTGLSVLILKEGVYLSWDAAPPGSPVTSYDVYRSTTPGEGYLRVNAKPVPAPYFLDGAQTSLSLPSNGEDYFYVVTATDAHGKTSADSDELAVTPQGMEIAGAETAKPKGTPTPEAEKVLAIPEKNLINIQLPADTSLSIQGYKKIEADLSFQNFYNRPVENGLLQEQDTTLVNQELVVNLTGKVGKNVDVNVDYSDVNRAGGVDQSKQDISIVYHGEENSPIQEVEFGDLQLLLPNTQFAGFSKNLFGLQAKLKFDNFRLTTFFAQTKGISATKVFTGNTVQVDKVIQDIQFIPYKYFLITRENLTSTTGVSSNGALPAPNTEQIWVDPGNGQLNPIGPNFGGPNNAFEHWLPGRDYTMDYSTGIITFIRALPSTARIAVGFQNQNGQYRGLNAYNSSNTVGFSPNVPSANLFVPDDGIVGAPVTYSSPSPTGVPKTHIAGYLIKDNNNSVAPSSPTAIALSPLYLVNYFDLGRDKIVPPQNDPGFLFQVIAVNNSVLQTGQGVSQIGSSTPWVYNVDLDFNYLTVTNSNFSASTAPTSFLWPERPFANLDLSGGSSSSANPPDVYSQSVPPTSQYSVHIRYKTESNNYSLGQFNIIRGSESVYLDGRRLRRDVDYLIDYTSGFLDFPDKSILSPSSQVVVTYEYAPFGATSQNNILGARAEYDITDNFFIGSTFLEDDAQQPLEVPQIGSTPDSLTLFDADTRLDLSQDDVKALTSTIPGLENWKPPLSVKLSGEIAQSYYNPDTYNAEGENGVAMIDNMQGIDNATSASTNQTSWLVSAPPESTAFLGNVVYDSGADSTNNRTRFFDQNAPNATMETFQTIGTSNTSNQNYTVAPGYGGHVYAQTGQANDATNVLQFPYSNLSSQTWAGLRQTISVNGADFSNVTYFDSWVYNDGNSKWIMVDFGVLNEDVNGVPGASAGSTFFSDPNEYAQPQQPANPLYCIPTYYYPGNPWSPGGSATAPVSGLFGPEQESQEGVSVGQNTSYVSENMNGTNILNTVDAYYEYGVQATWTGWHEVKIPVNLSATSNMSTTPDGLNYFFNTVGQPSPTIIRSVRVWMTGTNPTPMHGDVYFENLSFTQNLWVLQVDPTANQSQGVTVNPTKFDVNSISQAENSSFQPTLRFVTVQPGQDQNAILYQEKALDITYNLSSADYQPSGDINGTPIYYATRLFNQGLDLTNFQDLRFDLYLLSYQPGDVLFIRVGNDPQDYYQYNVQLSGAAVTCLNTWGTVDCPLNGSGGNRIQVGTPYINRATNLSFGVVSPNPPSGFTGNMWIMNLRGVNSAVRTGVARRANAAFLIGADPKTPFATLNARYQEVDSGFTQIDQTNTHFQHSTQIGADYTSSGVSLFSQPLVTQASYTHQDLTTESQLLNNPYYIALPDTHTDNVIGSIGYTKDLGPSFGRLTAVRLSGSYNYETDTYQSDYLSQPGVQGNTQKDDEVYTVASTYDAPAKLFFIPLGANQLTETYTLTHDYENFLAPNALDLAEYDRTTRTQTYGWTNTTEIVKNLVFTPGYTWTLTDAVGNTTSPGVPVSVSSSSTTFTPFQKQEQPKAGLTFKGFPGFIPSITYTGSNSYDWVSYQDGLRFTNANNLSFTGNLTLASWFGFLQKINPTCTYSRTYAGASTIPAYRQGMLTLDQQWGIDPDFTDALTGTKSQTDQVTGDFKLFDVWDFRPTATWTTQLNLLSQGTYPVLQNGETLGLTTVYNRKILTLPFVGFSFDSAQLQYTHTDNTQYDSSVPPNQVSSANIANETTSDLYGITLPYDLGKGAGQGNIHLQQTTGTQDGLSTLNTEVTQLDQQGTIEYDQRFTPHIEIHVPFTHWIIKMGNAVDLKTTFLMEFVNNQSSYINNETLTQRYRATIDCQYNAITNLRVGLGLANEYFTNQLDPELDYTLWQGTVSAEARF